MTNVHTADERPDRGRVLIVVSSRHGATTEIAGAVAQELAQQGLSPTVTEPDDCPDVTQFDAVVVGSAVYLGRWMKPARRFVREHTEELACSDVWLFSSGPLGDEHESGLDADHLQCLTKSVGAREHREFGGRLEATGLGPIESVVARAVDAPRGDFREWDDIREWARRIAASIVAG